MNEAELTESERDWAALDPDLLVVAIPAGEEPESALRAVSNALPGPPLVAVLEEAVDQLALRRVGEYAADVIGVPLGARIFGHECAPAWLGVKYPPALTWCRSTRVSGSR